jgi:TPR repeat protein
MKLSTFTLAVLLATGGQAYAAEQEETFTVPELGADYVDGQKLSKLMEKSDPKAATNIGWLFARGEGGVKQSFKEAMLWWKFAASRGFTPAMNNVGLLYANGDGVPQDFEEAFKWWMRAAERGDAWAMNAVGDLYENGQGVQKNYELAMTWYREAAREGDGLAMWNVAHLHHTGLGVDPNPATALEWYVQSAAKGHAPAFTSVGRMHQDGTAGTADPVEAFAWFTVAARRLTAEHAAEQAENAEALRAVTSALDASQRARGTERADALDGQYPKPVRKKANDGSSV